MLISMTCQSITLRIFVSSNMLPECYGCKTSRWHVPDSFKQPRWHVPGSFKQPGYFHLFTLCSLTSQAANDLFIVGNVPRTKGSIQGVVQTISRIGVCSAQIEVFRVFWRPKTLNTIITQVIEKARKGTARLYKNSHFYMCKCVKFYCWSNFIITS